MRSHRRATGVFALACVLVASSTYLVAGRPADAASLSARIGGADRYATAAAIAQQAFPETATTVFLAAGGDYTDALVAGPAAAKAGAPLLITAPDALSASTAGELQRLHPSLIVIIGGLSAISDHVAVDASRLAGGATVERWAGVDRYATAVALVDRYFPGQDRRVYIASGHGFADALSGAAAAAATGHPLLLTAPDLVPGSVTSTIERLGSSDIVVLGGSTAVSSKAEAELSGLAPVRRLAGATRYATSVAVARDTFGDAPGAALVASGAGFADALVASMLAGRHAVPILLADRPCLPGVVEDYVGHSSITLIGGTSALSPEVLARCRLIAVPDEPRDEGHVVPAWVPPGFVLEHHTLDGPCDSLGLNRIKWVVSDACAYIETNLVYGPAGADPDARVRFEFTHVTEPDPLPWAGGYLWQPIGVRGVAGQVIQGRSATTRTPIEGGGAFEDYVKVKWTETRASGTPATYYLQSTNMLLEDVVRVANSIRSLTPQEWRAGRYAERLAIAPLPPDPRVELTACLRSAGLQLPDPQGVRGVFTYHQFAPGSAAEAWNQCGGVLERYGDWDPSRLDFLACMASRGWILIDGPMSEEATDPGWDVAQEICIAETPDPEAEPPFSEPADGS